MSKDLDKLQELKQQYNDSVKAVVEHSSNDVSTITVDNTCLFLSFPTEEGKAVKLFVNAPKELQDSWESIVTALDGKTLYREVDGEIAEYTFSKATKGATPKEFKIKA